MRQVMTGLALTAVLLASGCSAFKDRDKRPHGNGQQFSRWDSRNQTAATLVAYLNENSRQMQALSCTDVTLDCKAGNESGAIPTARLDCQKPRNFRLTGKAVGQPVVDIGSNDKEFWYWISKANPPYVAHCSHDAIEKGNMRMPIPIRPDMVLAALGMHEYDTAKHYDVRVQAKTYELIENYQAPSGQQLQKVIVFNRSAATGNQPQVMAHVLRTQQGNEICRATITDAARDPRTGVELPRRIVFVWPSEKIEMKMKLDGMRVVPPDPQVVASLYSRRNLASQPSYDLERGMPDSPVGQVQRATNPPRD